MVLNWEAGGEDGQENLNFYFLNKLCCSLVKKKKLSKLTYLKKKKVDLFAGHLCDQSHGLPGPPPALPATPCRCSRPAPSPRIPAICLGRSIVVASDITAGGRVMSRGPFVAF